MKKNNQALKKIILSCIFITTIIVILTSCSNSKENRSETIHEEHESETIVELTESQFNVAEIKLGEMQQKKLSNVLKVNGMMDVPPQNLISVSAPMGGFVVSTALLQGMKVKKGQLLVVLEHPDYVQLQQDYVDKKSQLEYLEIEFKRQEELNKENVSSSKVFQKAKSEYTSMKAQLKGLQEKLGIINIDASTLSVDNISRNVNIFSPINGYVSVVNVNIGKYVNSVDVMFEIVNTEHLHAELTVFEKDVALLKIGQNVRFTLPNVNAEERTASIHLIGRKIDNDRSVRVHAHLENEDEDLLPGMYISAFIELNENQVSTLPEEAVLNSDGKFFVYGFMGKVSSEDTSMKKEVIYQFEMMEVKKGVSENGYTEIEFIQKDDNIPTQLVVKGAFSLLAKMKNSEENEGENGH